MLLLSKNAGEKVMSDTFPAVLRATTWMFFVERVTLLPSTISACAVKFPINPTILQTEEVFYHLNIGVIY